MTEKVNLGKKNKRSCKICGNDKGLMQKYEIGICRSCFKERAEKIGFRKYT